MEQRSFDLGSLVLESLSFRKCENELKLVLELQFILQAKDSATRFPFSVVWGRHGQMAF